jgi:hypothetical protein
VNSDNRQAFTMSSKSAPLYSSFGKSTKDLLTKGFPLTSKVEVTTQAENGVNFMTSFEQKQKEDGGAEVIGTLQEKYKLASHGVEFTGTIDTANTFKGELALENLGLPGLKTTLKGQTGTSQEVEAIFEYKQEYGTCTSSFLWKNDGKLNLGASTTFGQRGIFIGIDSKFKVNTTGSSGTLESLTGAVNYKGSSHDISAFVTSEAPQSSGARLLKLGGSVLYSAGKDASLGTTVDYDLQKPTAEAVKVKFGASYNLDGETTAKARFDTEGKLALAVSRQLNPHFKATLGTEVNTFDLSSTKHKFGFSFELKA